MVWHYALMSSFHTLPNVLKNPLERGTWLFLYTNTLPLTSRGISVRAFTLVALIEIPREVKGKAFVYKQSQVPLSKMGFNIFGSVWKPYIRA